MSTFPMIEEDTVIVKGAFQLCLTRPLIACFFDLSVEDAAYCMKVSMTTVRKIRTWFGVSRWPYRLLCSRNVIANLIQKEDKAVPGACIPEAYSIMVLRDEGLCAKAPSGGRKGRKSIVSRAQRILGDLTLKEVWRRRAETMGKLQASTDKGDLHLLECLRSAQARSITEHGYFSAMGINLPPDENTEFEWVYLRMLRERNTVDLLPVGSPGSCVDEPSCDELGCIIDEGEPLPSDPSGEMPEVFTKSLTQESEGCIGMEVWRDAFDCDADPPKPTVTTPVKVCRPRWSGGEATSFHRAAKRTRLEWTGICELEGKPPLQTGDDKVDTFLRELSTQDVADRYVRGGEFASHFCPGRGIECFSYD